MSEKDYGGYVYAQGESSNPDLRGITRRDWLAGLAMQGMISNEGLLEKHEQLAIEMASGDIKKAQALLMENISRAARLQADAMIAEEKIEQKKI